MEVMPSVNNIQLTLLEEQDQNCTDDSDAEIQMDSLPLTFTNHHYAFFSPCENSRKHLPKYTFNTSKAEKSTETGQSGTHGWFVIFVCFVSLDIILLVVFIVTLTVPSSLMLASTGQKLSRSKCSETSTSQTQSDTKDCTTFPEQSETEKGFAEKASSDPETKQKTKRSVNSQTKSDTDLVQTHQESDVTDLEPVVGMEGSTFCLPCQHVYLNRLEVKQNRFKVKVHSDDEVCCEEPHSDLKTFVQRMYVAVHYREDRAKGLITFNNATNATTSTRASHSLKLTVKIAGPWHEVNGTFVVALRTADDNLNQDGLRAPENGTVKIKNRGLFYIYSQVPFKHDPQSFNKTQYIYRIRNEGEELLLQNSVFPCKVVQKGCMQSFVGGVFLLEEGDKLCLRVSHHQCLDESGKGEFGIQRL